MEDIEISFEVLESRHCASLALLYRSIFGKVVPPDYFVVKYGLTIASQKQYSVVGTIDGKVIGFFGAIPQEFQLDAQSYELVYTCDFFLEEIYRGTGVFKQLYEELLERLKQTEASYLYAFHSEQTYKFCKKNHWMDASGMVRQQIYTFPRVFKSIHERLLGPGRSIQGLEKRLQQFQCEDALESFLVSEDGGMVYTKDFFKMKAFVPRYFVEIAGCVLWMKYDYRLTVGWVQIGSQGNVREMIQILKKIARRSGIHEIVFHTAAHGNNLAPLKMELPTHPSFKLSMLPLKKDVPSFSRFKINFINGDLF